MKQVSIVMAWLLCHCVASAQLQNTNISNSVLFEGEPYLAVNPVDSRNMVIAWMGVTVTNGVRIGIKSKATFDGGQTWGNYHVKPHMSSTWNSADVSMAFRQDGLLYLTYIDYNAAADSGAVFIVNSPDGGISWGAPVKVVDLYEDQPKKPVDRPWLAVDNSGTANQGMLYVTTKPAPWVPAPCRPYMKASADSGMTWGTLRFVDTANYLVGNLIQAPMAANAVTADGAFCAVYPSYVPSQSVFPEFYLAKSYNRAASFQYTTVLTNPTPVADTNFKLGYRLVANPANALQMAFVYPDNSYGDPDVLITRTSDGGQTWSTPVRVNNDPAGNGKAQDMVWADYNEQGDLLVTWRDRRNGSGTGFYNQPFETYAAVSHDNGATFAGNLNLCTTLTPFDSALADLGNDFLCCKLVDDTICATWSDYRSGKLNVYFARLTDTTAVSIVQVNAGEVSWLQVYPSPAKDYFTIETKGTDGLAILSVTDAEGKVFYEKRPPASKQQVNCEGWPSGVYQASITVNRMRFATRFIVNK